MLVRGVVRDQVHNDPKTKVVSSGDQSLSISKGSEDRVDVAVVSNVVAGVLLGSGLEGREPDRVNAKVCDRRKAVNDARKVTNSIPISIRERTRIDLVNDGVTPPVGRGIGQCFRGKHGYNPNEKFTLCNRLRSGRADEDCVCRAGFLGANLEPWPCHW